MKTFIFSILAMGCLVSACQAPQRRSGYPCPCEVRQNPVTPKDLYYIDYYQSEPVQ